MEPLNTLPIQQFIKQVESAEAGRAKEVKMDIATAKKLSYALGITMARLQGELERLVTENSSGSDDVEIRLDGGDWS